MGEGGGGGDRIHASYLTLFCFDGYRGGNIRIFSCQLGVRDTCQIDGTYLISQIYMQRVGKGKHSLRFLDFIKLKMLYFRYIFKHP